MDQENGSDYQFPGFQICAHKDDIVFRRCFSPRLQRRAPSPLQLKPIIDISSASFKSSMGVRNTSNSSSSSSSSNSSLNSFYHSKDPIPLLSPLVLPSLLDSVCNIQQENAAKSHWIISLCMWVLLNDMYLHLALCKFESCAM